jgi:protein TonB
MAAGNTLGASPDRTAREAASARPYRAAHYAPASDLTEMPQVLNRDAVEIRRYYPKDALRAAIEGDVILRLVVDADGSIADVTLVKDPGHGLGAAALRAVREFRFSPGRAAGTPVATSIPFVIRFVIS